MMRKGFEIPILLSMLVPCGAHAEEGGIIVNPIVTNISDKEYRGGNKNWGIAQDSKGIMYVANNDGLLEYDGVRWTLKGDAACGPIRSVAVDSRDRVFTGGFEEFGVWDRDAKGILRYRILSNLVPPGTFVDEDIWRIRAVEGGVYFQSFAKIYYYDYQTIEVINPGGFILFMEQVGDRFLVHSGDRLLRLSGNRLEESASTIIDGVRLNNIRVILPFDDEGTVLLGTPTQGIYLLYHDGSLRRWGSEIDGILPSYDLNCALRLDNGDYIFGTILNGIYRTDASGRLINHFSTSDYLQNNTVLTLFDDSNGNIWAGLDKGISRLNYLSDFNFFLDNSGVIGSVYTAALHDGILYIGSNRGLFYIPWKDFSACGALSKVKMIPGSQGQIWSLKVIGGELLCGHNDGLMSVEGSKARFIYRGNGIFDMTPAEEANAEKILVSSYSPAMLFVKDAAGKYRYERHIPGFSGPCRSLNLDYLGNLWMFHMTRNVYKCKVDADFNTISGFAAYGGAEFGGRETAVGTGRIGQRPVFVADDRFYLYDDIADSMVPYTLMNSLAIKALGINQIVAIDRNYSWLVGKNTATLLCYTDPRIDIVRQYDFENFNVSTVDGFENVAKLNDTLSLVCLDNGFLIHNIRSMGGAENPPRPAVLKSVRAYDSYGNADTLETVPPKPHRIPYAKNSLDIQFSYPDMPVNKVRLKYRLNDVVPNWSEMPGDAELRLERLPEGVYTLRVKAVDYFDRESPESTYDFRIMPPWYASGIALAGYAVLAAGTFFALWLNERMRLRKRHIRRLQTMEKQYLMRQNEELRNEVKERESELFEVTNKMISRNKVLRKIRDELDSYKETVPASRFPEKLYGRINELIDSNSEADNDWKLFAVHFEQHYKGFFNNVKARFPNLTASDLKLCACLKLNLNTKDIASLLCISVRGVEIGRYRLRKKMGIDSAVNLNDYFIDNF